MVKHLHVCYPRSGTLWFGNSIGYILITFSLLNLVISLNHNQNTTCSSPLSENVLGWGITGRAVYPAPVFLFLIIKIASSFFNYTNNICGRPWSPSNVFTWFNSVPFPFSEDRGCAYCGGLGHRITDCPKLEAMQSKEHGSIGRKDYLAHGSADW